jgi:hypothetical protein
MKTLRMRLFWAPVLLLAGCSQPPAAPALPAAEGPAPQTLALAGGAATTTTASVTLRITDAFGYRVLEAYYPSFVLADIDHVVARLLIFDGARYRPIQGVQPIAIPASKLSSPLPVPDLQLSTAYQLVATAYRLPLEDGETQIDTGNTPQNSVSFTTPKSAGTKLAPILPIQLTYKFRAIAPNGVTVTNGTIVNPASPER